jgi:O-antigen biosynthesis protein WbqP
VTGWAQVNGRDDLAIPDKVRLDREYLDRANVLFDLAILARTARMALTGRGVRH